MLVKPTAKGVDLSRYNGNGNWAAAKAAGIDFAIIRGGGVYWDSGKVFLDDFVYSHFEGAKSQGIITGLYWYFLPFNPVAPQLDMIKSMVDKLKPDLPIFIDAEKSNGVNSRNYTAAMKTLVTELFGVYPMVGIYTRQSFWDYETVADALWKKCILWVSRWKSGLFSPWSDGHFVMRDWRDWAFWQYSGDNNGKAAAYGFGGKGFDPDIDLNYYNGSVEDMVRFFNIQKIPTIEERLMEVEKDVDTLQSDIDILKSEIYTR